MIARGVRLAARLVASNTVIRDKTHNFAEYEDAREYAQEQLESGWGRQPQRGKTFGATYIEDYRADIAALYEEGNKDKNCKVSPEQVC